MLHSGGLKRRGRDGEDPSPLRVHIFRLQGRFRQKIAKRLTVWKPHDEYEGPLVKLAPELLKQVTSWDLGEL